MFRLDLDRMHVVWSAEDHDLAMALLEIEGFAIARCGGGRRGGLPVDPYRCADGWEQRIVYAHRSRAPKVRAVA